MTIDDLLKLGFYEVLGVEPGAATAVIKKAYCQLAREHHPDKGGDVEVFKFILLCYETLVDTGKRRQYDRDGKAAFVGHYKKTESALNEDKPFCVLEPIDVSSPGFCDIMSRRAADKLVVTRDRWDTSSPETVGTLRWICRILQRRADGRGTIPVIWHRDKTHAIIGGPGRWYSGVSSLEGIDLSIEVRARIDWAVHGGLSMKQATTSVFDLLPRLFKEIFRMGLPVQDPDQPKAFPQAMIDRHPGSVHLRRWCEDPKGICALFVHDGVLVEPDSVKQLINAAYNSSGKAFLLNWCAVTKFPISSLPSYYADLLDEVKEMGKIDMQDTDLVERVRAAGYTDNHDIQCRVTFSMNERVEATRREAALAAFKRAGCILVSLEHDGTPVLVKRNQNLVQLAAAVGVKVVVKPYRSKAAILDALKQYDPALADAWDQIDPAIKAKEEISQEVTSYLLQKKKEDRNCPMAFSALLRFLELPTAAGVFPLCDIFVSVPKNKDALYVWRWTWKWQQFPSAVQSGYLTDQCKEQVKLLLGPGIHAQNENIGMFHAAVKHAVDTFMFNPGFTNSLNTDHNLILFECGRALRCDTKELVPTLPCHMMSLSTKYKYPSEAIDELKKRLNAAGLNLREIFNCIRDLERSDPNWEEYSPTIVGQLTEVSKIIVALHDIHDLYEPAWALTMHVMKFIATLFFSRKNEENGFPLGEGSNGKSWLMFVIDTLLGEYSCSVQAGVYGKPVPSCASTNTDWLALVGRKALTSKVTPNITKK